LQKAPPAERRWQKKIAKYIALISYLWAMFASALCLPLIFTSQVSFEIWLNNFPQSESSAHVGAWDPWAATGLVLLSAFVARYEPIESLWGPTFRSLRFLKQFAREELLGKPPSHDDRAGRPSRPEPNNQRRTGASRILESMLFALKAPPQALNLVVKHHWRSLKNFCCDPDNARSDEHDAYKLEQHQPLTG